MSPATLVLLALLPAPGESAGDVATALAKAVPPVRRPAWGDNPPRVCNLRGLPWHWQTPSPLRRYRPCCLSRYIAWAEVNATTGGIAIDRKALLERCAIAFRDYREYKDDERYIKVCLKYADACEDPREVFLFMEKKGIGVASLLTYQCWALVHENMGQVQEAERVYETGKVKCTGQDAQKLAGLQQLFRERAAEAARHKDEDQDEEPAAHSGRQAFAEVKRKRGGRAANNRAPTGKSRGGLKALRRTGDEKSNAGKLEVFHDPEGEQSSLNPAYSARSFPAESDTRKENAQAAGNWKRGVKSKAKEVAPCNFAIFQDEEDSGPAQ